MKCTTRDVGSADAPLSDTVRAYECRRRLMKRSLFALALASVLVPVFVAAQPPTSRTLVLGNIVTMLPPSGVQDLIVQLWDDPLTGTLLFSEAQPGVSDDANSAITLVFGSQTATGLDPAFFP
jgi:hypothetical protein